MGRRGHRSAALVVLWCLAATACSLEPVDLKKERPLAVRSTVLAADGTFLARLFEQNRALVDEDEIPSILEDAVLAAEDARFFEHPGYDLRAIARAAIINFDKGKITQGGSTITQQYVKNTFFRNAPRTFKRKARELRLAIEIERRYTKDEILDRYLNTVYLGQGAYGVKVATKNYFGHGLKLLTLKEAALLAAVIKAPSFYDPRDHPKRAVVRRNYVLDRMVELNKIDEAAAEKAKEAPLGVAPDPPRTPTREPYFVEAVKREIMSDRRFGKTENERARNLYKGGLRIETTLEPDLQKAAVAAIDQNLGLPGDPEASLVAIRPSTGEIVAMVGGRDWNASQVNLALGKAGGGSGRQPGSSFKPIVAATALETGISLDTYFAAGPASFLLADGSTWTVRNSEGTAGGLLPLDEATVRSVNGVYARLALELGPSAIVHQAKLMGIRSRIPAYPSIALGSAQVSVLDMATAYATLANMGTAVEPTTIKQVRAGNGEIIKPKQKIVNEAISPGNAFLLTKVLEQVIQRGTGKAADIGRPAAGKTGTTNEYHDAWFAGYTPDLAVAVWVGYRYPEPMISVHGIRVFGGTFPAAIWRDFMLEALRGTPVSKFKLPQSDMVTVLIDPVSGLLAAPWCAGEPRTMLRQLAPTTYCPQPPPPPPPTLPATPTPTPTGRKGATPNPTGKGNASPEPTPTEEESPKPKPKSTDD
ncbi:MAG TPA: PBP1A family penicillin-binding protein [Actinomycetota bacterium]|nr:PBP1A family penicillin-binding protein [Actinomycetota bacterium]